MKREFRYPIQDRPLYASDNAARAGERAFGRPADLNDRKLVTVTVTRVKARRAST